MRLLERCLDRLRACFAELPDRRRGGNRRYAMADAGMAALSVFHVQSPSFLAHQRALAGRGRRSNAHTLFGLERIPCDNQIRNLLDGVPTERLDGQFHAIVADLDGGGALAAMRRLDGRALIALDGTEFHRSRKVKCPNCSTRERSDGGTDHFHQMVAATVVAPGQSRALPLPPEFVTPQDGADKQDCERAAAKRWLKAHGARCAALRPVYLGDDLYACQPVCQAMLDAGGDFLLTAKPGSHKTLYEWLDGIKLPVRRRTTGRGAQRRSHRYRWLNDLPIRDGRDALRVNWLEVTSKRPNGKATYRGAFVTSLPVTRDNVAELADCARARWKIENESFNVLKRHGYHLEHNFGKPSPTCSPRSTCSPSPCTPPATSPRPSGRRPESASAPADGCSSTCEPSRSTKSSPTGTPSWPCWTTADPPPSRPETPCPKPLPSIHKPRRTASDQTICQNENCCKLSLNHYRVTIAEAVGTPTNVNSADGIS